MLSISKGFILLSVFTSTVLTEFYLDYDVRGKTVTQTRVEKRIIECQLDLHKHDDDVYSKFYFILIPLNYITYNF